MGYKEWKLNDRLKSLVGKFGASYFVQSSRYFINSKLRKRVFSFTVQYPLPSLKEERCAYLDPLKVSPRPH